MIRNSKKSYFIVRCAEELWKRELLNITDLAYKKSCYRCGGLRVRVGVGVSVWEGRVSVWGLIGNKRKH